MSLGLPLISFAYKIGDPLVPCNNTPDANGVIANPCNYTTFILLINNVISFILFDLAIPIAAVMFFYAGFLLIKAQGGEAKTKAKEIFMNAVIGLVFVAAAWLIVQTLLSIVGYKDIGTFFKL